MMSNVRNHPSSLRNGLPHRRVTGVGGYRLPQRLVEGSRFLETELRAGLAVFRGSRFEVAAPERI